jgi:putative FmdB family regulatory protein
MPIYEYECEKCRTTFEIIQPISAKPLKKHGENGCDGKVKRLVSVSGFILKGSGWYVNDYPSDSRKQGWDKDSPATPGTTEAPAAKAESAPQKPEAKPSKPPEPAAKPVAKKSTAKSPYAGGRKPKKTKTSK